MSSLRDTGQAGNYFQTDTSLSEIERKAAKAANTQGSPVRFASKLLAIAPNLYFDALGDVVFVAEAAGSVTGLRLSTNELITTPRGAQAPLTSLAFHRTKSPSAPTSTLVVYAGCWDKSIWAYAFPAPKGNVDSRLNTTVDSFAAHQDFVKCLLVAPTPDQQQVLISGGADGDVRIWTLDGQPLAAIKPNCRGIECLALDPLSPPEAPVVVFSTSKQEIFSFALPASTEIASSRLTLSFPIVAHETSVYKLHFDDDGDLWTASADKTVKHLVRHEGWRVDMTLPHPDFVRDVVTHDQYGWTITACRDEEVRVWSKATGDLHHVFCGHYEEVTGLCVSGSLVISIGIDSTLRRWSLAPTDLAKAVHEAKNPNLTGQEPEPPTDLSMLTEEEEAELRALMESEEEQTLEMMARDEQ